MTAPCRTESAARLQDAPLPAKAAPGGACASRNRGRACAATSCFAAVLLRCFPSYGMAPPHEPSGAPPARQSRADLARHPAAGRCIVRIIPRPLSVGVPSSLGREPRRCDASAGARLLVQRWLRGDRPSRAWLIRDARHPRCIPRIGSGENDGEVTAMRRSATAAAARSSIGVFVLRRSTGEI